MTAEARRVRRRQVHACQFVFRRPCTQRLLVSTLPPLPEIYTAEQACGVVGPTLPLSPPRACPRSSAPRPSSFALASQRTLFLRTMTSIPATAVACVYEAVGKDIKVRRPILRFLSRPSPIIDPLSCAD